jgi:hypothetical protein
MSVGRIVFFLLFVSGLGCTTALAAAGGQAVAPDPALVNQKVTLLENLLTRTKSSERYAASDNGEARELIAEAEELAAVARENLGEGDLEVAAQGLDEAFNRVFAAARMCRKETGSTFAEQVRYQELLEGIDSLKSGWEGDVDPRAGRLVADAQALAEQDDYRGAIKLLGEAYEMVASAVALSRDKETVVYSLDFATPEDEYDYEVRRYGGNRMIIDLLLDKHPGSTAALVNTYVAKAEAMRESAEAKAATGSFESAVRDMEAAGKHQQRALNLLGIQS